MHLHATAHPRERVDPAAVGRGAALAVLIIAAPGLTATPNSAAPSSDFRTGVWRPRRSHERAPSRGKTESPQGRVGSGRREALDQVIPVKERHLLRLGHERYHLAGMFAKSSGASSHTGGCP